MFCNYDKKLKIHKKDFQTFIIIEINKFNENEKLCLVIIIKF